MARDRSFDSWTPPPPGGTLDGRFHLQRLLGRGNFGAVYLAEQRVFHTRLRDVALKLLHGRLVTELNVTTALRDAIQLMQLQEEPRYAEVARHLVRVIDAGFLHDCPGQAFISMEYVNGYRPPGGGQISTLEGLIRHFRPVPVDLALRWMLQVLTPIAWMHTLPYPVLHCDLKPDNILAAGQDMLKVADFGLAQLAFGVIGSSTDVGALMWQAPETLNGLVPTPAADVYALGLIMYGVLAGRNPLADVGAEPLALGRDAEYRRAQIEARAAGLPSLAACGHPELSDHPLLIAIVERCLRLRTPERYDNAALLLRDVATYAEGHGVTIVPGRAPDPVASAPAISESKLLGEARLFLSQRQFSVARGRSIEAQQRFPRSGKPYASLARIFLEEGRHADALRTCAEGMSIDKAEPELYEVAGAVRMAMNQPVPGEQMLAHAARLRQDRPR